MKSRIVYRIHKFMHLIRALTKIYGHVTIPTARIWTISITPNTSPDPPRLQALATTDLLLPFLEFYASGITERLGFCFWILSLPVTRCQPSVPLNSTVWPHRHLPGGRRGIPSHLGLFWIQSLGTFKYLSSCQCKVSICRGSTPGSGVAEPSTCDLLSPHTLSDATFDFSTRDNLVKK